jgi:hypothetical protein
MEDNICKYLSRNFIAIHELASEVRFIKPEKKMIMAKPVISRGSVKSAIETTSMEATVRAKSISVGKIYFFQNTGAE